MEVWNDTRQAVNPYSLAIASGIARRGSRTLALPPVVQPALLTQQLRGCACMGGLGHYDAAPGLGFVDINTGMTNDGRGSILGSITQASNLVPGYGQMAAATFQTIGQVFEAFKQWFHIGAGRVEADVIVPSQNRMMARLGEITNGFLIGRNPSIAQLQDWYREVWEQGVGFMEFVLLPEFTDRRASGQALNTVMPYIDGTCGYAEPLGIEASATAANCISWGDGTLGGIGTDGMIGALGRAIRNWGGQVPHLPTSITEAANSGFEVETSPPPPYPPPPYPPPYPPPTTAGFSTLLPVALGVLMLMRLKRG